MSECDERVFSYTSKHMNMNAFLFKGTSKYDSTIHLRPPIFDVNVKACLIWFLYIELTLIDVWI